MRWIFAATCAGLLALGTTGCNQNDAALRAEIEALKANQNQKGSGENNKLLAAIIAGQDKSGDTEALERKVNSLSEDIRAGMSDLKAELKTGQMESKSSLTLLEDRMDKVTQLQTSILTLKTMIEALETKVKNVDPAEMLAIQKDLLTKDMELKAERENTSRLEGVLSEAKETTTALDLEIKSLREQVSGLEGDDISKHPMYKKLKADLRKSKDGAEVMKRDRNLWQKKHNELLKQIGNGGSVKSPASEDSTKLELDTYDYRGKIVMVSSSAKPGDASNVLMSISEGTVPPLGAEVIVLDSDNKPVCHVKVVRHYHVGNDSSMPVHEIGAITVDERASMPVTKGDVVVWNKPNLEE